ncbi:MAG: alpha/beta hydrolase [Solobacterium sp.]|nr:alpha/beta hydrolase [Solobacterium sp.]
MVSKEAQAVIDMLFEGKRRKKAMPKPADPRLALIDSIYAERHMTDERGRNTPLPEKLTRTDDNADGVLGEWLRYTGEDRQEGKVILFVHGGAFNTGSAVSRRNLTARLVLASHIDSFSINYRLCPEYKYPAHLDDCVTAYLWLLKKGYAPQNIYFFGESAGANLVLSTTLYLKDHYFPVPGAVCAFSPSTNYDTGFASRITRANRDPMIGELYDEEEEKEALAQYHRGEYRRLNLYCTEKEGKSPYCSPCYGDYTGFPRLMINVGTEEMLYDDAQAVYAKAKEAGVDVTLREWEGLFHVFVLFDIPEARIALQEIADFYNR